MAFEPDNASDIYANMVTKRASMHPTTSKRSSTLSMLSSNKSSSTSSKSILRHVLTPSDPKERKMLPDGTKLGRPIDGIQYVKGSMEEKMAQMAWTEKEMQKAGIL